MSQTPRLYPLFAQLQGRKVLVVGGGAVAERKTAALLASGAHVSIGAPVLTAQLASWAKAHRIIWMEGVFDPDWLDGVWLVIAATDDREVNARVSTAAGAHRIWANVVDDPQLSSFQVPATVDRGPVSIAVSSAGTAPMLARRIRERIEAMLDSSIGELAALLGRHREQIVSAYPGLGARRRFYDRVYEGPLHVLLRTGQREAAETWLRNALHSPASDDAAMVTLLAVQSDDTGSLTLDGLRALNLADVLVYDPDASAGMAGMARRDAERVPFRSGQWSTAHAAADTLLDLLNSHRHVVVIAHCRQLRDAIDDGCAILARPGVLYERLDAGGRSA